MVMAVYNRTAKFRAHLIKLIAEMRHLICAVLVTGNNLINRVYDNGDIVLLARTADKFRCELVHRHTVSTQIPDVYIPEVIRF